MQKSLQAWAGELVGTFMFVTVICGSVILATGVPEVRIGLVGIGLAHAFGLGAVITAFAAISGGHFNPAVTLSAWIGRKISSADALGYVACQVLGALGAGIVLRVMFTESVWKVSNIGTPGHPSLSGGKALLIEALLTFIFVMVIWGTGIDDRGPRVGGFAIGTMLGAMVIAFGPLTGVGLNPARYLGPAAVAGHVDDWWIYILGPVIGAVAAGVLYPAIFWGGWPWASSGSSDQVVVAVETAAIVLEEPMVTRPARKPAKRKPAPRKR